MYSVYLITYADQTIKQRVEDGQEDVTQPDQLEAKSFYTGTSQAQAECRFSQASLATMNNELAYSIIMKRDGQVIIWVKVERPN